MLLLGMDSRSIRSALASLACLASCDGGETIPDTPPGQCWPLASTPGGQVEAGTGALSFEPMPAILEIDNSGVQSDPFIKIHARMRGMPPGDPNDAFAPNNPKTKVSAVIDELGLTLDLGCPGSLGYVPSPEDGAFDLAYAYRIGFGTFPIDQASGKQARITVEVVGSNQLYARDEKLVTLMAPP